MQASILLLVTAGTLLYTIYKERIRTLRISNAASCILVGAALGTMSAFLGIGGGPINLVVLFLFHGHQNGCGEFPVYHLFLPGRKPDRLGRHEKHTVFSRPYAGFYGPVRDRRRDAGTLRE